MSTLITSLQLEGFGLTSTQGQSVFENTDLQFPLGKLVWLTSEAGGGKSVFLKCLNGLVRPTAGKVFINGEAIHDMSFEEFLKYRLKMGYSFDFGGLIHNRTLLQNLILPLDYHRLWSPDERMAKAETMMKTFGIWSHANERPSSVSGAVRKALCVARAFIHEPEMVLLDDPTTGLRGDIRINLKKVIADQRQAGSLKHILVATEDFDFIANLADEVLEIRAGTIRSAGMKRGHAA